MGILSTIFEKIFGTSKASAMEPVDVEKVVAAAAANKKEKLNWKESIVDLMKALDMDSSLNSRNQLAKELGYTGALGGTAEMNIWLHKTVMQKIAENGGKLPDSMLKKA